MAKITSQDYTDDTLRIYGGQSGHLSERDGHINDCVHTDNGTVEVIINGSGSRQYTILQTARNGYRYIRQWERAFSTRYVKTLCKQFMDDVQEKGAPE